MNKNILLVLLTILILPSVFGTAQCDVGCTDVAGCGAYIDNNHNGACDLGEDQNTQSTTQMISLSVPVVEDSHDLITGQELKTKSVKEVAEIYSISIEDFKKELSDYLGIRVSENHEFQLLHDKYEAEPSKIKEIALELKEESVINAPVKTGKDYKFIPITITTILLYFTTLLISKRGKLKLVNHRKIWNILLLLTFLISGLLGILLVIRIQFQTTINLGFNILAWHVYAGIPMALISIFHILWHMPYLKRILKFN